jgi:catechol 2,3-dioxygenase-like lactoylglutathione lyase family enzyme
MKFEFPSAVPEIPVSHIEKAAAYYETRLGFRLDWGGARAWARRYLKGELQDVSS